MAVTLAVDARGRHTGQALVHVPDRQRPGVHAAAHLRRARQHAQRIRARFGAATFSVKSRAQIKGHGDLTVEDVFTGDNATLGAATAVAGPSRCCSATIREPITLNGLDVSIETAESSRSVTIERVWLDEVRPREGRTVPLKV